MLSCTWSHPPRREQWRYDVNMPGPTSSAQGYRYELHGGTLASAGMLVPRESSKVTKIAAVDPCGNVYNFQVIGRLGSEAYAQNIPVRTLRRR
jgi:hypothetical protein